MFKAFDKISPRTGYTYIGVTDDDDVVVARCDTLSDAQKIADALNYVETLQASAFLLRAKLDTGARCS